MIYGAVRVTVGGNIRLTGKTLHHAHQRETQYHLHCDLALAGGATWDCAINVGTDDADDLLQYRLVYDFHHADTIATLTGLPPGATPIDAKGAPALDYLRSTILNETGAWRVSDVMDGSTEAEPVKSVMRLLQNAQTAGGEVFIFGRFYEGGDLGIHDTHMNQGSTGAFLNIPQNAGKDVNAIWQDGALFVHLPQDDRWVAYFAAFENQRTPTDDNGNPLN